MRVICALSAGIRASFTNDACASNARDLPDAGESGICRASESGIFKAEASKNDPFMIVKIVYAIID